MIKKSVFVDDTVVQLWGRRLSYDELKACEALGWVQCQEDKSRVSWKLTAFGKLLKGPIHTEYVEKLTIVDKVRYASTIFFPVGINPEGLPAEVVRTFEILQKEGVLCRIGGGDEKVVFALTAKGLFTERKERELSGSMKRLFRALQARGEMERRVTNLGEWVWGPTTAESADRLRSATEPAMCALLSLELSKLVEAVIDYEMAKRI